MNATELNISVLAKLVTYHGGTVVMPNAIPRDCTGSHLKRCQKAGLFTIEGKTIKLTPDGLNAVVRYMETDLQRWARRGFGTGSTEAMYKANAERMGAAYINLGGDERKCPKF